MRKIYLTGIEKTPGKSFVSLGVLAMLLEQNVPLRCHKLFQETDAEQPHIIANCINHPIKPIMGINEALTRMQNNPEDFLNTVLESIEVKDNHTFDYFEGTDFKSDNAIFEYPFNLTLAYQLNCDVILVVSSKDRSKEKVLSLINTALNVSTQHHARVVGVIINRVTPAFETEYLDWFSEQLSLLFVAIVPEFEALSHPSVADIVKTLDARVLYGQQQLHRLVSQYTIAAKTVGDFLRSRLDRSDMLIITPTDRVDILLGSLLADQSSNYPKIAGIALTGGELPDPVIQDLIAGLEHPFPVLLTELKTFETATALFSAKYSLVHTDKEKIKLAINSMRPYLTNLALQLIAENTNATLFSPAAFLYELNVKAKKYKKHIVLPEGHDPRILQAAAHLLHRNIVQITLLGNKDIIAKLAKRLNITLPGVTIIDIEHAPKREAYAKQYFELRKHKNINLPIALERMSDANFFATMMVYFNDADGLVSGAMHTTADTVRPALEIIKTKPMVSKVSSIFIMCLASKVLIYGDCAINPEPDSAMLAEIALQAANSAKALGITPKLALLSYSSGTSGKGESVEKVAKALTIVQAADPTLLVEGPIQYDAAVDPNVARKKLPHSKLAGEANVLIFPDLNTGNNTYKAVQRETGALAIGPILLGLNKPVNDLSRGCTPQDIINTILITAIQAQGDAK